MCLCVPPVLYHFFCMSAQRRALLHYVIFALVILWCSCLATLVRAVMLCAPLPRATRICCRAPLCAAAARHRARLCSPPCAATVHHSAPLFSFNVLHTNHYFAVIFIFAQVLTAVTSAVPVHVREPDAQTIASVHALHIHSQVQKMKLNVKKLSHILHSYCLMYEGLWLVGTSNATRESIRIRFGDDAVPPPRIHIDIEDLCVCEGFDRLNL